MSDAMLEKIRDRVHTCIVLAGCPVDMGHLAEQLPDVTEHYLRTSLADLLGAGRISRRSTWTNKCRAKKFVYEHVRYQPSLDL